MKYRTLIELICDAIDKDDAIHTAGEFLRGEVESGVDMRYSARTLRSHRAFKYGFTGLLVLCLISTLYIGYATKEKNETLRHITGYILSNTCTIQPVLKTQHTEEFKEKWENKKSEVMFDHLKK
ncbi:MAG: hypothetical protein WBD24_02215 [Candidatus Omnitrophota bacterium]